MDKDMGGTRQRVANADIKYNERRDWSAKCGWSLGSNRNNACFPDSTWFPAVEYSE
jgi:hypothetical protein